MKASPFRMQQEQADLEGCLPTPADLAFHKAGEGQAVL